jgi:hypothetical protein
MTRPRLTYCEARSFHVADLETWKWYCRIDGTEGSAFTREERDQAALRHRDVACSTRNRPNPEWAEYGHLVHVWRW